ncbi:MAG: copper amine oxidase N-terminal domain-containing protein [Clostridia bacterium]|nr:copper amine oxidase N-terminal domain-containing protein [Clostridia bacterium]
MKLRKVFISAAVTAGMCAAFAAGAYAENSVVTVEVDNAKVEFDQDPIVIDPGYTMVPIRAVFEKAGAAVSWDQPTQTATIVKNNYTVTVKYGDTAMYKNGERIELDSPAISVNDRILIPVRAFSEAMDFAVTWDGHHSRVSVSTNGGAYRPHAFVQFGFKTLEDAAEFYLTGQATVRNDLDRNGSEENIKFAPFDEVLPSSKVLEINGMDYTADLGSITSAYALAVADLDTTDTRKELVFIENGDTLIAHFYYYDNGILKEINNDSGSPAVIAHSSKLFLSGSNGIMVSDLLGTCFVDIMVTGSVYRYTDNKSVPGTKYIRSIPFQMQDNTNALAPIFGRNLYRTYYDDMPYYIIYTAEYKPGTYKDFYDTEIISSDNIEHFKILNGYIDKNDLSYIEFFIELPDGRTAVIKPYKN